MPITRRGFLGACMSAGAFALTPASADASVQRARWYLFGTLVDVSIRDATPGKADQALADLGAYLSKVNREWNAWKPGALSRLNAAIARGEPAPVEGGLARLMGDAQLLQRRSAGLFNPAIGQAVGLWGLHSDARPRRESPALAQLERVLAAAPSLDDLSVNDGLLSSRNPAVQLDLGSYAKGHALGQGMDLLRSAGVDDAMIEAGGDLCTLGGRWAVGVRHPQARGSIARLETGDREVLFTSGSYGRHLEDIGRRFAHILDPRTGLPVEGIASATVLHGDGALADAASTALVVAGPERWPEAAAAMGIEHAMVVDARGRVQLTAPMAERVGLSGVSRRALTLV